MKARFKTILLSALGVIVTFTAVTYSSCKRDKCKAVACANGGVCTEGACTCQSGYEGSYCEREVRQKFIGIYNVTEKGTNDPVTSQYTLSIQNGQTKSDVIIKNFGNRFLQDVQCYVKSDTLFIPLQKIDNRWEVQGMGIIDASLYYGEHGTLTVRYSVKDDKLPSVVPPDDFGTVLGDPSIWNK